MVAQRTFILGLCWLALVMSGCRTSERDDTLGEIMRRGELRWGADIQGGEPYVFEDPEHPGRFRGFEAELAEALGRELGVRTALVQNDWSTLVPSLERGTFDMIMNGLELTPAHAQRVRFTRPYCAFTEQLVTRAGDQRIHDLASLRGLRVGTLTNSLAWDMLEATGAERVAYEGVEEPFADLLHARTDAVLLDDIIVARFGNKPGLHVAANVGGGVYAIGLRKDDERLQIALDRALSHLLATGALAAILQHWDLAAPLPAGADASAADGPAATMPPGTAPHLLLSARELSLFGQAALVTLAISSGAMLLAMSLGLGLALLRLPSPLPWRRRLARCANVYVELFRGTPVLLQLYVLYYGLAPLVSLDAWTAAILGLGLNYAAYEAEIYRAGIKAVPIGEIEAAHALGLSGALALRRVILPQAFRIALPGIANDFIALLKDSSLVSVITVVELTKRMTIASVEHRGWLVPGALCALLYLAMSYPLSQLSRRLEQRLEAAP